MSKVRGAAGKTWNCIERLEDRRLMAAGDLDPAFGVSGHASFSSDERLVSLDLLAGDKMLALFPSGALRRLNANGSIDTGFGSSGSVSGILPDSRFTARGAAVMPDGRIVVVANHTPFPDGGTPQWSSTIVRLKPDGTRDTTFGSNGVVSASGGYMTPTVLSSGTILVTRTRPQGVVEAIELVRYSARGKLDTTFGGGDGVAADHPTLYFRAIDRVLVQPDGKILVGGWMFARFNDVARGAFALGRLNADGTWDTSFGEFGLALTPVGPAGSSQIHDLALLPDGKILAVGEASRSPDSLSEKVFAAVRYNPNGTIDTSYGTSGGYTLVPFFNEPRQFGSKQVSAALNVFLEKDGAALLAGYTDHTGFSLTRIDPSGTMDVGFGRVTDWGGQPRTGPSVVNAVRQSSGRIVMSGQQSSSKTASTTILLSGFSTSAASPAGAVVLDSTNKTLSLAGTGAADVIFVRSDGDHISARVNGFARIFNHSEVALANVAAGGGNDVIDASHSAAPVSIQAGDGDDRMVGGEADDSLTGNAGKDRMDGGGGNDRLAGNGGRDKIAGGNGNDRILGGASGDFLAGQHGADEILGEGGLDRIDGGDGPDTMRGGPGDDFFSNGRFLGRDLLFGDSGSDWAVNKDEDDQLVGIEKITE